MNPFITASSRTTGVIRFSKLAAAILAGLLAVSALAYCNDGDQANTDLVARDRTDIQNLLQVEGTESNGVFTVEIDRNDIANATLDGVPILPAFEIKGTLYFQRLAKGMVMMNGDAALKPSEVALFTDSLLAQGVTLQAQHEDFDELQPTVMFVHFRRIGTALSIAKEIRAALAATSTPYPQILPQDPTTPLPAEELAKILRGTASVGANGVVTVNVPREDPTFLDFQRISPNLGVQTTIAFQPLADSHNVAVIPDFGMRSDEIQRVLGTMRRMNWEVGCLYNQETAELPQLYFSHMFKVGDAGTLAEEVRRGLNQMDMK